jgi:hypothetical protein
MVLLRISGLLVTTALMTADPGRHLNRLADHWLPLVAQRSICPVQSGGPYWRLVMATDIAT